MTLLPAVCTARFFVETRSDTAWLPETKVGGAPLTLAVAAAGIGRRCKILDLR
jgi:hypothetical protein